MKLQKEGKLELFQYFYTFSENRIMQKDPELGKKLQKLISKKVLNVQNF